MVFFCLKFFILKNVWNFFICVNIMYDNIMWKIEKKLLFLFLFLGGIIDNWVDFMKKEIVLSMKFFF